MADRNHKQPPKEQPLKTLNKSSAKSEMKPSSGRTNAAGTSQPLARVNGKPSADKAAKGLQGKGRTKR